MIKSFPLLRSVMHLWSVLKLPQLNDTCVFVRRISRGVHNLRVWERIVTHRHSSRIVFIPLLATDGEVRHHVELRQ
jgi:hypothetical protein